MSKYKHVKEKSCCHVYRDDFLIGDILYSNIRKEKVFMPTIFLHKKSELGLVALTVEDMKSIISELKNGKE